MKILNPTQYQIWLELKYDPFTGVFTRRSTGKRACRPDYTKGYLRVFVLGKYYKAHRLAWYYRNAVWPTDQIDHIDGNKMNNAITNLRDVNQTTNMYNKVEPHKHNTTKTLGVGISGSKFVSKIKVGPKLLYLGTFDTKEEAHARYCQKKDEILRALESRT